MNVLVRTGATLLVILLVGGVAGLVMWMPDLEKPSSLVVPALLVWAVMTGLSTLLARRWWSRQRDLVYITGLTGFFLLLPAASLTLWLNRQHDRDLRMDQVEIFERFQEGNHGRLYLFLWDGDRVVRRKWPSGTPAEATQPGDSILWTRVTGWLGLHYTRHVPTAP